ncbi:MAG: hypothetical protein AAGU11_16585 [Syntrophobacteraceae bacterium]
MIPKLWIILLLFAGLAGCASAPALMDADSPGKMYWAGGETQLFFSNPEYNSDDELVQREIMQRQTFGVRRGGFPDVTGGIGAMQIWRF